MDQGENGPSSPAVLQRKSKSYRQSYRSCLGGASRLAFTPGVTARRLNSSRTLPKARNIKEQLDPEHLALLSKTEWHLSYVTPLFQFTYTQLKTYGRQLSAFIAAEKQKGLAVDVEASHGCKVNVSLVQGLVESKEEPETVLVQIVSKPMFSRPEDPERPVWSGWFSCVDGSPDYLASLPEGFVCLPLFCSSGPQALTSIVKTWFQRTFDCCFGALELDHTTLLWLMALWTNCQPEADLQNLKMLWTIPVEPPLQITYAVRSQDAWDLWSGIRKSQERGEEGEERMIDIQEVVEFMQELKTHFYRHFRLDLSAGNLSRVATALGSAKSNGRIKISNSRYFITTLSLLTECALLKMPI
uniref:Centromere protein L n=1 Tax=Neogobius melanostomus TaxID=47308 RepID=A0A8C6UYJ2_9GOBI